MDTSRPVPRRLLLFTLLVTLLLLALLPLSRASAPQAELPALAVTHPPTAPTATRPAPSPGYLVGGAPTPTPRPSIQASAAVTQTITFRLAGDIPAGAREALLWYDTVAGHSVRRIDLGGQRAISASVTIVPAHVGLTVTRPISERLDYWWAVRDSAGALTRAAGTLLLPPQLAALAQSAPITAPAALS